MNKFCIQFSLFFLGLSMCVAQDDKESINKSLIAFTVPEKDLIPESIAYDPVKGDFFIGSTRKGKILRMDKNGKQSDFATADQHGLWMVIGIKIDVERRILWACSSGGDNLENYGLKDDVEGRPAGVFKFDLDNARLLEKFVFDQPGEIHFFNDIAIAKNGDVYITHMFNDHAVYRINNGSDSLEKVYESDLIKYPNGIAFSNGNKYLYVAHSEGVALVDIGSGQISPVEVPEGVKISRRESIDGLYFHENSLIGIQTDINTVSRFFLDESGHKIIKSEALEINHPLMDTPTTGEIVGNDFYYIANAQFDKFDENGLFPMHKLYEPVVLKVSLND